MLGSVRRPPGEACADEVAEEDLRGQKASRKSVLIAAGDPLKRRLISDVFAVHEKWPLSKHFSQSYSGTVAQLLDELLLKRIYFDVIVLDKELPGRSSGQQQLLPLIRNLTVTTTS